MKPREITDLDLAYWGRVDPRPVIYAADDETFNPCPAIHTRDENGSEVGGGLVVRVPVELDETERAKLAQGRTLWLSMWGGLSPWFLEVGE